MSALARTIVLCASVAAGCGGTVSAHATHDGPGDAAAGGAGGAGTGGSPESDATPPRAAGGAPPDASPPPLTCPGEPPLICAWNCDAETTRLEAGCYLGEWVCGDGLYDVARCADNPCLGRQVQCCRGEVAELSLCVDHANVCPEGTELRDSSTPCGGCEITGCGPGEYCSHAACRKTQGVCKPKPTSCDDVEDPVCTCDGTFARNACEAALAGKDLGEDCAIPDTQFYCASRVCVKGVEYCRLDATADGRYPACDPIPDGCDPTEFCTCLTPPGESCECGSGDGPFIYCFGR